MIGKFAPWFASMGLLTCFAGNSVAQGTPNYPNRSLSLIVANEAGGLIDRFARFAATGLSERMGQPVVTLNRPGASETIAVASVVRAAPDGYTLLASTQTGVVLSMARGRELPYDSRRDLSPVALIFSAPLWLVVHPEVQAQSVAELVALAKANPGKLAYASIGAGTTLHLAGELFKRRTGTDILHVPYKGTQSAFVDLLTDRVQIMFSGGGTALPNMRIGKLRALASTGEKRSFATPNLPTVMESGVPRFNVATWMAVFAPANVPRPIVERLNREITSTLTSDAGKSLAEKDAVDLLVGTPEELGRLLRDDITYWTDVLREVGVER